MCRPLPQVQYGDTTPVWRVVADLGLRIIFCQCDRGLNGAGALIRANAAPLLKGDDLDPDGS